MKYMKLAGYDPCGRRDAAGNVRAPVAAGRREEARLARRLVRIASAVAGASRTEQAHGRGARPRRRDRRGEVRSAHEAAARASSRRTTSTTRRWPLRARRTSPAHARWRSEAATTAAAEGRFHELLGEISLAEKQPQEAMPHYQKAIDLNPDYFGSYLGAGVAQFQSRQQGEGRGMADEERAAAADRAGRLLPRHDRARARRSGEGDGVLPRGRRFAEPHRPDGRSGIRAHGSAAESGQLRRRGGSVRRQGRLFVVVQNRAPVPLRDVQVTPVLVDGRRSDRAAGIAGAPRCGAEAGRAGRGRLRASGSISQEQLPYLRFRVDGARVAE